MDMEIEFSQKVGNTTIRLRDSGPSEPKEKLQQAYQSLSEFWQFIVEYELSLLPEDQNPKRNPFKKL